jgi:hypothetical protein
MVLGGTLLATAGVVAQSRFARDQSSSTPAPSVVIGPATTAPPTDPVVPPRSPVGQEAVDDDPHAHEQPNERGPSERGPSERGAMGVGGGPAGDRRGEQVGDPEDPNAARAEAPSAPVTGPTVGGVFGAAPTAIGGGPVDPTATAAPAPGQAVPNAPFAAGGDAGFVAGADAAVAAGADAAAASDPGGVDAGAQGVTDPVLEAGVEPGAAMTPVFPPVLAGAPGLGVEGAVAGDPNGNVVDPAAAAGAGGFPRTVAGGLPQGTQAGALPQGTQAGALPQGSQAGGLPQGTPAGGTLPNGASAPAFGEPSGVAGANAAGGTSGGATAGGTSGGTTAGGTSGGPTAGAGGISGGSGINGINGSSGTNGSGGISGSNVGGAPFGLPGGFFIGGGGGGVASANRASVASLLVALSEGDDPVAFANAFRGRLHDGDLLLAPASGGARTASALAAAAGVAAAGVTYSLQFASASSLEAALGTGLPPELVALGLQTADGLDDATFAAVAGRVHGDGKRFFVSTTTAPVGPTLATIGAYADDVELVVPGATDAAAVTRGAVSAVGALRSGGRARIFVRLPSASPETVGQTAPLGAIGIALPPGESAALGGLRSPG